MPLDGAWNAYIFRDGKTSFRGKDLLRDLTSGLRDFRRVPPDRRRTALIDLLLRAGELEGALLDHGSDHGSVVASITDALAASLVGGHSLPADDLAVLAQSILPPETLSIGPPEGFAFYSLHPLDFADLLQHLHIPERYAAVIGIRSIGTTLSAVVQAALRAKGIHVERFTVRPAGHPYDRRTEFAADLLRRISAMDSRRAEFLVVDEGPGMSGSSFLSVGDALLSAGIPRARIAFLCTRDPHPSSLTAPQASDRWPSYRRFCTRHTVHLPPGSDKYVAGGIWRAHVFSDEEQWPASWLQMERLKFLSETHDVLYKFEGYGRFGRSVHDRSLKVAQAGFGPAPISYDEGFGMYPMLRGKTLSASSISTRVLQRLAEYCAFRSRSLSTSQPANENLETMLAFNVKEEFGVELPKRLTDLPVPRPVIADGRMLPHKWIDTGEAIMKVDCAIHGDDHFFPGPTDIAWDLAGAIVEWNLDQSSTAEFIEHYRRNSGDDPSPRLSSYLLAYSIFRTAYCKMASASMAGAPEEVRLIRDYERYRTQTQYLLAAFTHSFASAQAAADSDRRIA